MAVVKGEMWQVMKDRGPHNFHLCLSLWSVFTYDILYSGKVYWEIIFYKLPTYPYEFII